MVAAAPLVADLLADAPDLKVLITSRVVAGVYGEHDVDVPPLVAPDPLRLPPLDQLTHYEAVQLFITRAQAVSAGFALSPANAQVVAELCQQLEGLPLAIELAAARLRHLPLETILARLSSRLQLLTGGARTLPARQQTLRDTLAWSYDLLDASVQTLFRRLGVFVGGWALEAAEAVCNADSDLPIALLEGLAALVDHSLVQQSVGLAGEARFTMLETIREYALEQLASSGEAEALRRRHAAYYLALGERAEPELRGPQQATWLACLELEHNNLRAALTWSQTAAVSDPTAGELGVRLGVAVWEFWSRCGYQREGCDRLQAALARSKLDTVDPTARHLRARALSAAGNLAAYHGDGTTAQPLLEESLALFQSLEEPWWIAYVLMNLGATALQAANSERAMALTTESLALFRTLGDRWGTAWALLFLAPIIANSANPGDARADQDRAITLLEESVAYLRELGDIMGAGAALATLGSLLKQQGGDRRARELLAESLTLCNQVGAKLPIPGLLEEFAGLAAKGQQRDSAVRAVQLYGAAEALFNSMSVHSLVDATRAHPQETIATLRARLGEAAFATAWAEGRAMSLQQAIAYALDEGAQSTSLMHQPS